MVYRRQARGDRLWAIGYNAVSLVYVASVVSHYNLVISTSGRYLVFSYDHYDFSLRFEMTYCIAIYDTLQKTLVSTNA
jgi:hypothetical protein